MGSRDRSTRGKSDAFDYRILEVQFSRAGSPDQMRLVTVDNHLDTLMFIQGNMDACIENIIRLKRMEDEGKPQETA